MLINSRPLPSASRMTMLLKMMFRNRQRFGAELEGTPIAGNPATGHDDVFEGFGPRRFDADGIVARVDVAIADAHAAAGVDVDAVIVAVDATADGEAVDAHVFGTEEVTDLTRRILQGNARDLHVFAVDEPDHEGRPSSSKP